MRLELPKRTKNHFQLRTRWKSKCRRHFRLIGDWGFFKRNLSSARHWHKSNKSIATTQSFFETGTDVSAHLLGHETLFFNHSDWESGLDSFFYGEERKFKLEGEKKSKRNKKCRKWWSGAFPELLPQFSVSFFGRNFDDSRLLDDPRRSVALLHDADDPGLVTLLLLDFLKAKGEKNV